MGRGLISDHIGDYASPYQFGVYFRSIAYETDGQWLPLIDSLSYLV